MSCFCCFNQNTFTLPFNDIRSGIPVEDERFDALFPQPLRDVARTHFTPVKVALAAAKFLAEKPGANILDIGSGAGKFCLIGAACTSGHFTGVEQRPELHRVAAELCRRSGLTNVQFIQANITEMDFSGYSGFYFYNPFFENIVRTDPIDDSVELDKPLFDAYSRYVREQLERAQPGTRLATYFSFGMEIPDTFVSHFSAFEGKLRFWEKQGARPVAVYQKPKAAFEYLENLKPIVMEDPSELWKLRLAEFKKAYALLAAAANREEALSDLERQGVVQLFECAHEPAWQTLRDFIQSRGTAAIYGAKDATREAFLLGLIEDGEGWMAMIQRRNLALHTYDSHIAEEIAQDVVYRFCPLFEEFLIKMESLWDDAPPGAASETPAEP